MRIRKLQINVIEDAIKLYWKNVLIQDVDDIIDNGLSFPGIGNLSYKKLCQYFYNQTPEMFAEDEHILKVFDEDELLFIYNPQKEEVSAL